MDKRSLRLAESSLVYILTTLSPHSTVKRLILNVSKDSGTVRALLATSRKCKKRFRYLGHSIRDSFKWDQPNAHHLLMGYVNGAWISDGK